MVGRTGIVLREQEKMAKWNNGSIGIDVCADQELFVPTAASLSSAPGHVTISDSAAESLEDQIVEGDMAEIVEVIDSFAACSVAEAAQSFGLPESGYFEAVRPGSHARYPAAEETDSELADLAGISVEIGDFSWSAVLFTRWEGCVNVALPWELARMLYFWNKRWGMELVALSEDTEATMLVHVSEPGKNREEIVATLAAAGDELVVIPGSHGSLILKVWWD